MNPSEINVYLDLDTRRALKDGTFPVKIRVFYNRKDRRYAIHTRDSQKLSLSLYDFEKMTSPKPRGEWKDLKREADAFIKKAEDAIAKICLTDPPFSFEKFEISFLRKDDNSSVSSLFKEIIKSKHDEGRIGTARTYDCSLQALDKYRDTSRLTFFDITPKFLKLFEVYMRNNPDGKLKKGCSTTTISIHMRSLRTVFNHAIVKKIIPSEFYPFGRGKYQIPSEATRKRALNKEDIRRFFYEYQPEPRSPHWEAKNYFFMSYLCNGMNFADIAELKWNENITGDWLQFYRAKTKYVAKNKKLIKIHITDQIREIINSLGNYESEYVFPIYSPGMTPEQRKTKLMQFIKTTNKWLKRIANELEFDVKNISTYFARHSWATIQKRNGTSLELISDSLGHHSLEITQTYLDSFDEDTLKQLNREIL